MALAKVTFTLDRATLDRLRNAAETMHKPKSQVVREAIHDYHDRMGKLSESERLRMLRILEEIMARPPTRPQSEVDKELREIRRARRNFVSSAWRRGHR